MKILKLVQIDNVGKFQKYSCHGDMNLSDISLIYGENGKGKTTLSTILRSLKTGDVSLIREKKCAGGQGPINVKILLEKNRIAEFSEDSETWSIQNSDLEIFDSYHVNNNVYSGDHVDHTHKKNLYYLVIGEQGVHMAQEIEQIDSEIKDINDSIKVIENQIKSYISSKCSVESFVNLPEIENIGQRIAQVTNEIKELEEAESIQSTPTLTQVLLPKLKIEELSQLLEKSFETVSEEAKSNVITHCLSLGANSESWVKQGVDYLQNKSLSTCPFCQQNIEQIDIIQHFKMYFSQKYTELREEINSFLTIFESDFSENTLLGIQSTLGTNSSLVNFWEKYISLDIDIISFSQLVEIRKEIFLCVKEILYQKSNKPLEIIQYGDELSDLFTSYGNITSDIERYNEQILKINDQISSKKMTTQKGDLVKTRLIKLSLEDTLMRFSEEAKPICEDYISKNKYLDLFKS